ncbi:MAG: hypothetical protein MJZ82_03915 [Paludibacteraceae bacterium]|nr:hypothetical protein [Paludibacteraceae bacterium]
MRCVEFTSLESRFTFGRYKGLTLADVMDINPEYLIWCVTTIEQFLLYDNALEEIRIAYPNFPIYEAFERCRLNNLERPPIDSYATGNEPCDYGDDSEDYQCYDDEPTYDRYNGSYAQDVMGYSDDDIDTIFDGDPSACWNID